MENSETKLDLETMSFGKMLKTSRLEKNLTIDDIVAETRISKQVIEQIESKNPVGLPEPVFLRGFIKSYAEIVGLDPVEIVRMYKLEQGIVDKPVNQIIENGDSAEAGSGKHLSKILLMIAIVAFVSFILINFSKNSKENDALLSNPGIENGEITIPVLETQNTPSDFKLEVVCVEETKLKISADGAQVSEYNMKPEEHLELKAKEQFNILIDNTCGVTFFLNNKAIEIPGKCGQTLNIHLPQ